MRNILFLLLTLAVSVKGGAQTDTIPGYPSYSYTQHPELDKFVGSWKWTSGADTILLVLQKQKRTFSWPYVFYEDILLGWHRYVKNGQIIESDLNKVGTQSTGKKDETSLSGFSQGSNKIYFIKFIDLTLNKTCEASFTMQPNSNTQAIWQIMESRGMNMPPRWVPGFTLPTTAILFSKQ